MSTPDDEQLRRMGAIGAGEHAAALEQLARICEQGAPGPAASMSRMVAGNATQAAMGMQRLLVGHPAPPLAPPPSAPSP